MTEDKNLTPFSIADILKSDDRGDDGYGHGTGAGERRAKNSNEALDMTNSKRGNSRFTILY